MRRPLASTDGNCEYHIPVRVHQTGIAIVRAKSSADAVARLNKGEYAKVMYPDDREMSVTQNGEVQNCGVSPIRAMTLEKRSTFD